MKKNILFALICACVFGFAFSSCSSDEGNIVDESKTRASAVSGDNGREYLVYTDYITDVNDEYGVVRVDYFTSHTYIDCTNGNRYYLLPERDLPLDLVSTLDKLENAGILVEGNNVKFSGKVNDTDPRWIPGLQWRLDNYGWNDGAKEAAGRGLYNFELPTEGHTFWLVAPNFTITKAE